MQPSLASNSQCSCLNLLSAMIANMVTMPGKSAILMESSKKIFRMNCEAYEFLKISMIKFEKANI
jgi:hypothetical protein